MRKVLLVSAVALTMAGCAAQQQGGSSPVQVRDLTVSRDRSAAGSYRVEPGDTLYGIAWRHEMDFRELAQLNGIKPPYRLEPGQQLRLTRSGEAGAGAGAGVGGQTGDDGTRVASAAGGEGGNGNPDWLAPDEEAIERNRRLTARPLEQASGPSQDAVDAAAVAGGGEAPGPVFNYGSPGADGQLSERDLAEREAREQARRAAEAEQGVETEGAGETAQAGGADSRTDTSSSSSAGDTGDVRQGGEAAQDDRQGQAETTTAVAGGASEAENQRSQRTYTPVEDIPWQWPVDGEVVGQFGEGKSITAGIDIGGQKGQPVKAAGPGIVVYAGSGVRGYGNLILLKHNDKFLSAYAHNDSLRVKENDVVEAGEVIATMGDSDAEGVKLHFEVRKGGQPQDPMEYLPSR